MNILLVSDTHGRTEALEKLLNMFKDKVDLVCHMGDYGSDLRKYENKFKNLKIAAVNGNTDYSLNGQTELIMNLSLANGKDFRLLVTHGHRFGVKKNLDRLIYYAKEMEVDAVFFGHTHTDVCFYEDEIFVMNPGSLTFGTNRQSTYGLVKVHDDLKFTGKIVDYEG